MHALFTHVLYRCARIHVLYTHHIKRNFTIGKTYGKL